MSRFFTRVATGIELISISMLLGCNAKSEPAPAQDAVTADSLVKEPQSEINRELTKLPDADRTLAGVQKECPVSGEPLGSMGAPIKVTVKGRSLFVCCKGCEEDAKKNFDEYFAKLETHSGPAVE